MDWKSLSVIASMRCRLGVMGKMDFVEKRLIVAQGNNQKYPRVGMGFSREVSVKCLSVSHMYSFCGEPHNTLLMEKPHTLSWWESHIHSFGGKPWVG